jgi:hypothetical protein
MLTNMSILVRMKMPKHERTPAVSCRLDYLGDVYIKQPESRGIYVPLI